MTNIESHLAIFNTLLVSEACAPFCVREVQRWHTKSRECGSKGGADHARCGRVNAPLEDIYDVWIPYGKRIFDGGEATLVTRFRVRF